MGTAFTEEEGRIFLVGVEVGRKDYPYQHIFVVSGFHPSRFNLSDCKLVKNMLVFICNLCDFSLLLGVDDKNVIGVAHRMTGNKQLLGITYHLQAAVVVLAFGNLMDFSAKISLVDVGTSMPYGNEIDTLVVRVPAECIDIGIELLADVFFLASSQIIHQETVAVALIAIVSHAEPSNILAVG